jgi:hypothetical protein
VNAIDSFGFRITGIGSSTQVQIFGRRNSVVRSKEEESRMTGKASRLRFRLGGVAVAALLMVSPVLGGHGVAAQGSSDIDPDAAQELLDQAQSQTRDLDPVVDGDSFSVTQDAENVAGYYLPDSDTAIADFYLEFTVDMPANGDDEPFDFGSIFRISDDQADQFRLVFSSDNAQGDGPAWEFTQGLDSILGDSLDADVFDTARGSSYDVVIAAVGDEAAFSLNGEAIAVLDLSTVTDAGQLMVGSGFYNDTSVADRDIDFSNITLYDLEGSSSTTNGTEEATAEATEDTGNGGNGGTGETEGRGDEETPTAEATEEPTEEATTEEGDTYVSPTYGYSLEYSDPWKLNSSDNNPGTGIDLPSDGIDIANADSILLNNGAASTVAIYGGETTSTAKDCIESDINFFQNTDGFDFFSVAKDTNGKELQGETPDGDGYYSVIWVTNTANDIDTTVYLECRPFNDGEDMLLIEHYAADTDYNNEIDAREALLAGLDVTGAGTGTGAETPVADETPAADETPTSTSGGGGDLEVTLDPVGSSDVDGDAVISASGTTRSTVDVVAPSAPEGALVVVQEGSCDDLSGAADFDAGEIDENGESSDRIRITPDELDGNYALTIVDADTEDYAEPLACGDIG